MKKRNWLWILLGILLLVIVIGIWMFTYFMNKPLYTPGQLAETSIEVPSQEGKANYWQMGDGIELYHFAHGEGTNVLLLHGGPGMPFQDSLEGFNLLSDRYRVHYFDQRGSGRSTRPFDTFESSNFYQNMITLESKLGIAAHLGDIERIRQLLGEDELILVGHSFGGFLAALYAAEFPEHVKKMVLIAPAGVLVMPPPGGGLYEQIGNRLPEDMQEDFEAYMDKYMDFQNIFKKSEQELVELNEEMIPFYKAAYPGEIDLIDGVTYPEQAGWGTFGVFFSMGRKYDLRPEMKKVDAPVLVIHGNNDMQSEEITQMYVEALPNATFKVIEGAGHFPFVEKPEVFAEVVGKFFGG